MILCFFVYIGIGKPFVSLIRQNEALLYYLSFILLSFYIRKTKTDTVDEVLIAQVIRMDLPDKTIFPNEDIFQLKQLERFCYSLSDSVLT
ncbi:IS110 family transposase [Enterococcus faecalis]|nr:IS110 family transposase [Enterococcus faecalis]